MSATVTPVKGIGTTLSVTPTGGTEIAVGKLTSIGELTPDSDEIEVTTLDSEGGYREYLQGFKDPGELSVEGYYASGNSGQAKLIELYDSGESAAYEIEFPDGTTIGFDAFVKNYTVGSAEVDNAVGFKATMRVTGAPTITPAA